MWTHLEPAHDEEKLEKCEDGEIEVSFVLVKALAPNQTTQEERVHGNGHNLKQKQQNTVNIYSTVRGRDDKYVLASSLSFFFVNMITHKPLHLGWWNFAILHERVTRQPTRTPSFAPGSPVSWPLMIFALLLI